MRKLLQIIALTLVTTAAGASPWGGLWGGGSGGGTGFFLHKNTTDQTGVSASTTTKVTWSTEEGVTGGGSFDNTADSFTITEAGRWLLCTKVSMSNISSGARMYGQFQFSTATATQFDDRSSSTSTLLSGVQGCIMRELQAGTEITVEVWQNAGTVTLRGHPSYTWFAGSLLGSP